MSGMHRPLTIACLVAGLVTVARSQTLATLVRFNFTNGATPWDAPVQGLDGNFYGTTQAGGGGQCEQGCGTVFRMTPDGAITTLHVFCNTTDCSDGYYPIGGLVQARNGAFYGTTSENFAGTVFKMTPNGVLTALSDFCLSSTCPAGGGPADLIQAVDGNFYGTTQSAVFRVTQGGAITALHIFSSEAGCPEGCEPEGALVQATDGALYGTTSIGGAGNAGTIFRITTTGTFTTLYHFCASGESPCHDGKSPGKTLIQANDGYLYGTTTFGGFGHGTIFRITTAGEFTTLYGFCAQNGCPDGVGPSQLIQASDKSLYGLTWGGYIPHAYLPGTIFRFRAGNPVETLYHFCSEPDCTDGTLPDGMVQATDGNFYGTTYGGGTGDNGTIFRLSTGLAPFIKTQPVAGISGEVVDILGNNLSGATRVTFNGVPAGFHVNSNNLIVATVPAGASTGPVEVFAQAGTLTSNTIFRVLQ